MHKSSVLSVKQTITNANVVLRLESRRFTSTIKDSIQFMYNSKIVSGSLLRSKTNAKLKICDFIIYQASIIINSLPNLFLITRIILIQQLQYIHLTNACNCSLRLNNSLNKTHGNAKTVKIKLRL